MRDKQKDSVLYLYLICRYK